MVTEQIHKTLIRSRGPTERIGSGSGTEDGRKDSSRLKEDRKDDRRFDVEGLR